MLWSPRCCGSRPIAATISCNLSGDQTRRRSLPLLTQAWLRLSSDSPVRLRFRLFRTMIKHDP
jgi:hypothetical protein